MRFPLSLLEEGYTGKLIRRYLPVYPSSSPTSFLSPYSYPIGR